MNGFSFRPAHPGVAHRPGAGLQHGGARVDPALEAVIRAIAEHDNVFEAQPLIGHAQRMDHRLRMRVALPQPQAVARDRKLRGLPANVFRLHLRILHKHARRQRREGKNREHAEPHRNHKGRRQQIPGRNARRANGDQFLAARKPHEREDAAQQHGEGHKLEAQIGKLQQRHADHDAGGNMFVRRVIGQPDDVDGQRQKQEARIDGSHADDELARQIAEKCPRPRHVAAMGVAPRRRSSMRGKTVPCISIRANAPPRIGMR